MSLVGDAGIGKTTVWRACLDRLDPAWAWVTSCPEPERVVALAVLADFFAAAPADVVGQLPPPQRTAVDVVLLRAEAGRDAVDERLLGVTAASLLGLLALRGRIVLAIDDLDWCDPASLAALSFALRRAGPGSPVVLTTRRDAGPPRLPGEATVEIGPLDSDETARLVRERGLNLRPSALTRIVELSRGNPLYALELARAVPPSSSTVRIPPTLKPLLERRFVGLPRACRDALLDVAVRGTVRDRVALAPAHERHIVVAAGPLVRFSHPLLGEVVREQATPAQLRTARERAARASTDPVAAARHRALAATEPDEELAVALDGAAVLAQRRSDVADARDLAELALAMTPGNTRPAPRVGTLLRCEFALGNDWAARPLAEELAMGASEAQHRLLAFEILMQLSKPVEALRYAEAAARLSGMSEADRLRVVCDQARLVWFGLGNAERAERLLVDALAEASPDSPGWAGLVAHLAIIRRQSGRVHDDVALRRAVDLDRRSLAKPSGIALELAAHIATYDDRHDEARQLFTEAASSSLSGGDRGYALDVQLARLDLRVGRLREARAAAERISDGRVLERRRRDLATLARICAWQGDFDSAHRAISEARAAEPADAELRARAGTDCAEGFVALLRGDEARAWSALAPAAEALERVGMREPSTPGVLPLAIEAAAALGKLDEAEALCSRLASQSEALNSRWGHAGVLWSRGQIALARGDAEAAAALFDGAAAAYQAIDLPLDRARALLAAGSVLRRRGLRSAAGDRLRICRDLFGAAGADALRRAAEDELARLGRHGRASDSLTEAQRQVARLAAAGLRNTEIGERLRISPKTVERHLGQVYRKLGLRGRGELARALQQGSVG